MALGLTGVIPGFHYLYVNSHVVGAFVHFKWLVNMAMLYLCGGAVYAMRIPERIIPGKCDLLVSIFFMQLSGNT